MTFSRKQCQWSLENKKKWHWSKMTIISAILSKGNNFSDLLILFICIYPFSKESTLKRKNLCLTVQILPFKVDTYWKGEQNHFWQSCHPWKCILIPLHWISMKITFFLCYYQIWINTFLSVKFLLQCIFNKWLQNDEKLHYCMFH